ncbi:MAG: hypothetical protein JW984_15815 [Deltaproteobacteria bacterium]|uniref:Uncharacterized protein n=1 Tax=Candidatus Zymogenus saltonus TaxID=2844893 RepID=A0A9D8KJ26_9DELT|nr:hypothetical protein [Candidatus Zymogenus saltonus]
MNMTMAFYERHLKEKFRNIDRLTKEELSWLLSVHDKKIEYFKEERKMHFGAFALVTILFFIILPQALAGGEYSFPLMLLEGLLLILIIPYVFYYAWYENRLRKIESFYFIILEALNKKSMGK